MTPLERLLKSAAGTPVRPVDAPSFALESRVLAAWRAGRDGAATRIAEDLSLLQLCRRGLALAGIVAVVALVAALGDNRPETDPYAAGEQELAAAYNLASSQ